MGQSIKYDNSTFIDASGVWDRNHRKTQEEINQTTVYESACQYTYQQRPIYFLKTGNVVRVTIEGLNIPFGNTDLCNVPSECMPSGNATLRSKKTLTDLVLLENNIARKFRLQIVNKLSIYNYGETFLDNNLNLSFVYVL